MTTKIGLIVMIEDNEELNEAYNVLTKKGFDVKKGNMKETEPKKLYMPTGAELKSAMLELQELNGKDALKDFLKTHGATSPKTLKKSEWPIAYAELNELNNVEEELPEDDLLDEEPEDEFADLDEDEIEDDDMFGDDDSMGDDSMEEAPTPEEVKVACQKYAQKHSRDKATAVLKKNGLNTVRGLAKASDETLTAIMKAVN